MDNNDINGLDLEVTDQSDKKGAPPLLEDEWYNSRLVLIERKPNITPGWADQFHWLFELSDAQHTYNWQGKPTQRVVYGTTSLIFSSKPSKSYLWYSKMINREPVKGEKVSLKTLIGKNCSVMVKKHVSVKGKTSWIVEKVKFREDTVAKGTETINTAVQQQQPSQPIPNNPPPPLNTLDPSKLTPSQSTLLEDIF